MSREYRICKRCIMDTTDPLIEFDDHGHCNHCRDYDRRVSGEVVSGSEGEQRILALADRIRQAGQGKPYDCVLGLSGGVDSTMVAYIAERKMGLRPLAVHLDNGWNTELAEANIGNIVSTLGIEFRRRAVDWEEFRDLQKAFLKASVPNCEIPTDHAINATLFHTAARHDIRYILGGGNVATEGILPSSWGHFNLDYKHLRAIHRQFGTVPLKTTPILPLPTILYYVLLRGIQVVPVLNYCDYKRSTAVRLIQEELRWSDPGGKHCESVYTRFFQGYILPRKFGYDKRRAHLSTLICSGDITREAALEEVAKSPYTDSDLAVDMDMFCRKLDLTDDEFRRIMSTSPRQHTDYRYSRFAFGVLWGLRRAFKRIATRGS
jgi:N-acetyl sugar amidotransferase